MKREKLVPPPPPPPNWEHIMLMQTQILQTLAANLANPPQAPPPPPQSKLGEFMRTKPSVFDGTSTEPMEADDWLKEMERKLNLAGCGAEDKVNYAAHQLKGTAADLWDNYCAAHDNPTEIRWTEFASTFRANHIPAGVIELRRKEFLNLKQEKMTVAEYHSRFTQLARYAPNDVKTDADKIWRFMQGLNNGIRLNLATHDFPSFQHMVNKAYVQENIRKEMAETHKRKMPQNSNGAGSSRPRLIQYQGSKPQSQQPQRNPPNTLPNPEAHCRRECSQHRWQSLFQLWPTRSLC